MVDFKTLRDAFRQDYPVSEPPTQTDLLIFRLLRITLGNPVIAPVEAIPVSSTLRLINPPTGFQAVAGLPLELFAISTLPRTIGKVEFYAGATKIGEDRNLPYSITFTPTTVGALALRAVGISPDGQTQVSSETINISVVASPTPIPVNTPPTVSLANPGTVTAGQTVTLSATASDSDGISKVEFYQGATKLGEDSTSPYQQSWTPTAGSYVLTAVAYDTLGAATTSSAINVTVGAAAVPTPTISVTAPSTATTGASVTLNATASVSGDTIASVQFRVNGVNLNAPDTTSPYSTTWTVPGTAGTYTITAVATGTLGGVATSAAVTVTVSAPSIPVPTVTIGATTPKAGLINEAMALAATASVSGDTIASIQFRADGTNIGAADTTSPYSLSHTFTTKGVRQLSAVATGSQGGTATSANYSTQVFDTKAIGGGASAAGASLGAVSGDFILYDNNQSAGGNAATMNLFIGGTQVGAFNFPDTAYLTKPFAYYSAANNTLYTGRTIAAGTVNLP